MIVLCGTLRAAARESVLGETADTKRSTAPAGAGVALPRMLSNPRHSIGAASTLSGVFDNLLFDLQQGDGVDEARHEARRAAGLTPHHAQQPYPGETQTPQSEQELLQQRHLQQLRQQQQQQHHHQQQQHQHQEKQEQYQQQYQQHHQGQHLQQQLQQQQQQQSYVHAFQQQLMLQQQQQQQLQQQLRQLLQQNPTMVLELEEQHLQALSLQHLLPARHQQVETQQYAQQLPARIQPHAQQQQPWRQSQQIKHAAEAYPRAAEDEMFGNLQLDGMDKEIVYSTGGGFDSPRTPRLRSSSLSLYHLRDNKPESDDKRARISSAALRGLKAPLAQPSMVFDNAFGTGPHVPRKLIDRSALAAKVAQPPVTAAAAAVAVAAAAEPKPKPKSKLAYANQTGAIAEPSKRQLTSSYRGVCWYKRTKRWVVQIKVNGVRRHVGYFKDEVAAGLAYEKAVEEVCSAGDALPRARRKPDAATSAATTRLRLGLEPTLRLGLEKQTA
jgi:hypothetical protein